MAREFGNWQWASYNNCGGPSQDVHSAFEHIRASWTGQSGVIRCEMVHGCVELGDSFTKLPLTRVPSKVVVGAIGDPDHPCFVKEGHTDGATYGLFCRRDAQPTKWRRRGDLGWEAATALTWRRHCCQLPLPR